MTHTAEALAANERFRLQQRRQLFRNIGMGRFEEITDRAGPAFTNEDVGRGAAFGDLDNDGDTDIVVANDNGPVRVLINAIGSRSHWVGLRLVTGKRDALGARITVTTSEGITMSRRARADGSYGSANDPRVLVGLGAAAAGPLKVQVLWPSGRSEEWSDSVLGNRYVTVGGAGTP